MDTLGEVIRNHRKLMNLTQEELGSKLSVTKQTVSKWENGRSLPDFETMKRLIEILEINHCEILGGTVQEVKKNRRALKIFIAVSSVMILSLCIIVGIQYHKKSLIESGYHGDMNTANQYALEVTMVQLLATPEKYNGKLVRVLGVGNLEFEGNYISLSKEDQKYNTGNALWIELGKRALAYDEARKYNGKYVLVEGIFDKNDLGHLNMFRGSIKDISRYQLWECDDTE